MLGGDRIDLRPLFQSVFVVKRFARLNCEEMIQTLLRHENYKDFIFRETVLTFDILGYSIFVCV